MRPITGDCACGRWFVHPKQGRLRIRCEECAAEHKRQWHASWFVRNRQNNPAWAAKNKKIAKRWRAANAEHIRAYREARA